MPPRPSSRSNNGRPAPRKATEVEVDVGNDLMTDTQAAQPSRGDSEFHAEPIDGNAEHSPLEESSAPPDSEFDSEPSSKSSRRAAGKRSSRKVQASSGRKPSRKEVIPLTPEERARRAKARKGMFKLFFGLIIGVAAVVGLWYVGFREPEWKKQADSILGQAGNLVKHVEDSINLRQPDQAQVAMVEAKKLLADMDLHEDLGLRVRRDDMTEKLTALDERLLRAQRDQQVTANLKGVQDQFAKLLDPAIELDKLEADAKSFMEDPVRMSGVPDEAGAKPYAGQISQISSQLYRIATERTRRTNAQSTDPVIDAKGQARNKAADLRFQEALAIIDDYARRFPQAKFEAARAFIESEAEQSWGRTKRFVDSSYTEISAAGTTPTERKRLLTEARTKLDDVINKFGIDSYVSQAKDLRAKFPE